MKVGEFYKSIYNHYVSKVTKVWRNVVTLENRQGVTDEISVDNFDANWKRCVTIYEYRDEIEKAFGNCTANNNVVMRGDAVVVTVDDPAEPSVIAFGIVNNMLRVQFTDDVKEAVEADSNIMEFLLEDAFDVITMFADLFE